MDDLDALAERHGFPKPIDTGFDTGFRPLVAAQIDLDEPTGRTTCCCTLHGSLHNARTCCPAHGQVRAGIPVPAMTPIEREPEAPTYDTSLDPISPDFDLSSWA